MKDSYISCYLSGRSDEYEEEVDIEKIVAKAVSPGAISIREMTHAAAKAAIATEMDAAAKMEWLKDNLDVIKELGGDTEKAWRLFTQGRVDMLAYNLEDEVLNAIVEDTDQDDEEEGESDDEADDDDDGEDDAEK